MKLFDLLPEDLKKGKWQNVEPIKYSDDLISIVQKAYEKAPQGSFVNTKKDLVGSEWHSIDLDEFPDIDATIFYRNSRSSEPWKGNKIQGIGHDGSREVINALLNRLEKLLRKDGNWIEASDAVEHILYKMGVPYVKDEKYAQKVFPNSNLQFTGNKGQYNRITKDGKKVTETIFGNPVLK